MAAPWVPGMKYTGSARRAPKPSLHRWWASSTWRPPGAGGFHGYCFGMYRCQSCGALNNVRTDSSGTAVCGRCKQLLDLSGTPQDVDAAGLARVIHSATVPVLVDFWAPWCAPCRVAAPNVEAVARGARGRLIALKVNTDENQAVARAYEIQGIPTFILFGNGAIIGRQSGALGKDSLSAWVSRLSSEQATGKAQSPQQP